MITDPLFISSILGMAIILGFWIKSEIDESLEENFVIKNISFCQINTCLQPLYTRLFRTKSWYSEPIMSIYIKLTTTHLSYKIVLEKYY